ncbi:MAG: globin [Planctomycetota bacterium]|nr:globin [Planctomycetota bacterium]MDA1106040.1 globin [Planctomycetota bacterium]
MNTDATPPRLIPRLYEQLGPEPFWTLARAFYGRLDADPALRGMFPEDLEEPIRNQAEFLIQYFGGPGDYSARKGHPRLRMRHTAFRIGPRERDLWLGHMKGALEDSGIPKPAAEAMWEYFVYTADFLVNAPPEQ